MSYIDGFVAAVATANKSAYLDHARNAAQVLKEHGALYGGFEVILDTGAK